MLRRGSDLTHGVGRDRQGLHEGQRVIRNSVGNGQHGVRRHSDVFREGPVPFGYSEHLLLGAQVVSACRAVLAGSTETLGLDDDALSDHGIVNLLADFRDDSAHLVP